MPVWDGWNFSSSGVYPPRAALTDLATAGAPATLAFCALGGARTEARGEVETELVVCYSARAHRRERRDRESMRDSMREREQEREQERA